MRLYCGIDLHSNNHVVTVIDEQDRRLYERRLPNDLAITKAALKPFRAGLAAVAIESAFNWYWLVAFSQFERQLAGDRNVAAGSIRPVQPETSTGK